MTPLHYAKAIRTGLLMAEKARYEGGFRVAAMLDALARNDWRSAKSHWLMVELWVSQVNSISRMTLEMCRASRMPIERDDEDTRASRMPIERDDEDTTVGTEESPSILTNVVESHVAGAGDHPIPTPAQTTPPAVSREAGPTSPPSYFPPVLRP